MKISSTANFFVLQSGPMEAKQPPNMPPIRTESDWLGETRTLLQNRPSRIRLREIAQACGVSIGWLSTLQTGRMEDAPISKVQCVNKWLKENAVINVI
ncbi:MAG: hypothetical protein JWR85_4235 [Marmoricola sp.]|jgi:hypothetical protein|nr:hypothetical protein [Marmoricola sp.]